MSELKHNVLVQGLLEKGRYKVAAEYIHTDIELCQHSSDELEIIENILRQLYTRPAQVDGELTGIIEFLKQVRSRHPSISEAAFISTKIRELEEALQSQEPDAEVEEFIEIHRQCMDRGHNKPETISSMGSKCTCAKYLHIDDVRTLLRKLGKPSAEVEEVEIIKALVAFDKYLEDSEPHQPVALSTGDRWAVKQAITLLRKLSKPALTDDAKTIQTLHKENARLREALSRIAYVASFPPVDREILEISEAALKEE